MHDASCKNDILRQIFLGSLLHGDVDQVSLFGIPIPIGFFPNVYSLRICETSRLRHIWPGVPRWVIHQEEQRLQRKWSLLKVSIGWNNLRGIVTLMANVGLL